MEDLFKLLAKYPLSGPSETRTSASYDSSPIFKKRKGKDRVFSFKVAFFLSLLVASFPVIVAFVREDKVEINRMLRSLVATLDPSFEQSVSVDLESSEMILYLNGNLDGNPGLAFSYPKVWAITTLADEKKKDPTLVDTFSSQDFSDRFAEAIFINSHDASDITFDKLVADVRSNLSYNDFKVISEQEVQVKWGPSYVFKSKGEKIPLTDGTEIYALQNLVYIFDAKSHYIVFEFQDDPESFNRTSKKFIELIDSLKITSKR